MASAPGPLLLNTEEMRISEHPDRLITFVDGLRTPRAYGIAQQALREARRKAPRRSGWSANRLYAIYGYGFYGIAWSDTYVWYLENGINPFTMWALQGKTIPMWVKDPGGIERAKNPKIKTRTNLDGVTEVLIFRKATRPGAPGRIGTPRGKGGRIAPGNVGVKWRHPGLAPRKFLNNAISLAAQWNGILLTRVYVADANWMSRF